MMSYLDRTNVAFARVPMSQDLGFSESVYGIGSGLFFIGYFLLGIPGAMMVEKWGARLLVGSAAIAWGLVTSLFIFTRTPTQFYVFRLLLGLTAAPFFPGVIVHIARSFAPSARSRALAAFIVASPVSLTLGGPLSALMLQLHGFGLPGWNWIFLLEGLVTVLLGLIAFFVLDDSQGHAVSEVKQEPMRCAGGLSFLNPMFLCSARLTHLRTLPAMASSSGFRAR
jgi:MFS family permease